MYPPIRLKYALARQFCCVIAICVFLFIVNFVVSPARASALLASRGHTPAVSATDINLTGNLSDPDVTSPPNEEPLLSDPPATTETNNSTGDEILLRPPR